MGYLVKESTVNLWIRSTLLTKYQFLLPKGYLLSEFDCIYYNIVRAALGKPCEYRPTLCRMIISRYGYGSECTYKQDYTVRICRSEGDIAMETCPSYGANTTKPTVQDQVYEECDTEAYEKLN